MTVKFLMNMFKQSYMIMFLNFLKIFWVFWKNLYKHYFWLGGLLEEKNFYQSLFRASDKASLKEASCKISTGLDNYFKSYAVFEFFFSGRLVGLFGPLNIFWDVPEFRWRTRLM